MMHPYPLTDVREGHPVHSQLRWPDILRLSFLYYPAICGIAGGISYGDGAEVCIFFVPGLAVGLVCFFPILLLLRQALRYYLSISRLLICLLPSFGILLFLGGIYQLHCFMTGYSQIENQLFIPFATSALLCAWPLFRSFHPRRTTRPLTAGFPSLPCVYAYGFRLPRSEDKQLFRLIIQLSKRGILRLHIPQLVYRDGCDLLIYSLPSRMPSSVTEENIRARALRITPERLNELVPGEPPAS